MTTGGDRAETRLPEDWTDRFIHLARIVIREPFQQRTWRELGFFVASCALTSAAALLFALFGFTGLLLSVVFIGVLLLAGGLRIARSLGQWQRALASSILGETIPEPEPFTPRPGLIGWIRSSFADRSAWRTVGYFVAKIPLNIIGFWFALSVWLEAFVSIVSSLTGGGASARVGITAGLVPGVRSQGFATHFGGFVTGILLLLLAPWLMRLVVNVDRWLMNLLLGPDAVLSRVRSLEESRAKTVDASTTRLQRIERDLHDGTQAQLVALAMRLGQAKDKLDNLDDPATAGVDDIRRLVDEAHRGAKEAIADLRDLARGIHPPALDTGLENALATLGARSPIPTEVSVQLPTRLPTSIEAISYFCAAELLANVAQHAQATRASLTCAQHGPWLRVVVRDNGRGGATIRRGGGSSSGLAGLSDRVEAVDGHLSIVSPVGGPTVVTVDIPAPTASA